MRRLVLTDRDQDTCGRHGYCSVMQSCITSKGRTGFRLVTIELADGTPIEEVRYQRSGGGELLEARVYICPFCFGAPMARGRDEEFELRADKLALKKINQRVTGR